MGRHFLSSWDLQHYVYLIKGLSHGLVLLALVQISLIRFSLDEDAKFAEDADVPAAPLTKQIT